MGTQLSGLLHLLLLLLFFLGIDAALGRLENLLHAVRSERLRIILAGGILVEVLLPGLLGVQVAELLEALVGEDLYLLSGVPPFDTAVDLLGPLRRAALRLAVLERIRGMSCCSVIGPYYFMSLIHKFSMK